MVLSTKKEKYSRERGYIYVFFFLPFSDSNSRIWCTVTQVLEYSASPGTAKD